MPTPSKRIHTKETAEALLNELPAVMGAFVREDVNGHPREVHLLVTPGPDVRALAKDVRYLLEQGLGVPIDQRVISIAQLVDAGTLQRNADLQAEVGTVSSAQAGSEDEEEAAERLVLTRTESRLLGGRIEVTVALGWGDTEHVGQSSELESAAGRVRAGAGATLEAVVTACGKRLRLDLETASVVRALDRDFVLVSVLAAAPVFGRRPLTLVGAQPTDGDLESAAVLATLKAVNRVAIVGLEPRAPAEDVKRRPARSRGER